MEKSLRFKDINILDCILKLANSINRAKMDGPSFRTTVSISSKKAAYKNIKGTPVEHANSGIKH